MSWNFSNQLAYIETQIADISGLTDPLTNPLDCGNQNLYNIDDVVCNNDVTCNTLNYVSFNPPLPTSYRPTNNYYVAPNGNDLSGNGSILAPFQTIGKAIQYAGLYAPGIPTEIFIYAGTYVENITTPLYNLSFTAYNGGSGGDNEALPNQSVVLQGNIQITGLTVGPDNIPTTFNNIYFKNSQLGFNFLNATGADFSVEFNNCSFLINNPTSNTGFVFTGNTGSNYNAYFNNCDVRCTSNNGLFLITTANFYMNNCQVTASVDTATLFNFILPLFDPNTIRFNNTTVINTSTAPNNYYMIYFGSGCFGSITNCNFIYKSTAPAIEQSVISTGGGTFENFYNNQFICPGCTTTDPSGNICMLQMAGPSTTMVLNNCYNNYGLPGRTSYGVYNNNVTFNSLQQSPAPLNTITDISSGNTGILVAPSGTQRLISNLGVIDISGSAGINISGTKTKYQINNLGVLDLSGSLGIQITGSKTQYQINNLGIIDISNGNTGIAIGGPKNGRLIYNLGVNDISGGAGINVVGTKPASQLIVNTGVLDLSGSYGISITGSKTQYQINNTGITDISAGNGITITGSKPGPLTIGLSSSGSVPIVYKITTPGPFTYTTPDNYTTCFIYAVGGGGGGGGNYINLGGTGAGGGGAGYFGTYFTSIEGGTTVFSGTIGAGGTGGSAGNINIPTTPGSGTNGGPTTIFLNGFGPLIDVSGGLGGQNCGPGPFGGNGGNGGYGGGGGGNAQSSVYGTGTGGIGEEFNGNNGNGNNGGAGGGGPQMPSFAGGGGGPQSNYNPALAGPGAGGRGGEPMQGAGINGQPGMVQFVFYP